jgi:hypothetical protein
VRDEGYARDAGTRMRDERARLSSSLIPLPSSLKRKGVAIMRRWMLLLMALAVLGGCGHNPNHGISRDQALAAVRRIHPPHPQGTGG